MAENIVSRNCYSGKQAFELKEKEKKNKKTWKTWRTGVPKKYLFKYLKEYSYITN
jgi:hypothetical protein